MHWRLWSSASRMPSTNAHGSAQQHNIYATYLFTFFFWAARSILFQQLIAGFVFVLTNSNQQVGQVKGVQGIAQLLFSFPSGYLADHTRRDNVLKLAGALGLLAALLTALAVWECQLGLLKGAFALWGLFAAFQSPAMEAIFAESVPQGKRSRPFLVKYNISNIAMVVGPLLSIVLLLFVGDQWRVQELQPVLLCGCALASIASLLLFRFNDDHTIVEQDEPAEEEGGLPSVQLQRSGSTSSISRRSVCVDDALRTPSVAGDDLEIEYDFSDHEQQEEQEEQEEEEEQLQKEEAEQRLTAAAVTESSSLLHKKQTIPTHSPTIRFLCFRTTHVPYLLFASDFIVSNGAGITVYFFPLFFKQEYGLSPIHVSLLFLTQPLVVMALSNVAQQVSTRGGRMPVIVATRLFATLCLLGMSYAKPLPLQIALFLARGGMMKCSQPLRRSVLMDFVTKNVRARWNAMESVSVFSYSGSAVVGGYLVDLYGYRMCFWITTWVYLLGLSIAMVLLPLTKHAMEK